MKNLDQKWNQDASGRVMLIALEDQMAARELEAFQPWVPEVKWEGSKSFYHWQDRQRTVLGYSLTNYLLGEAGLARQKIRLSFDYYGKPQLVESSVPLFFNISHAGGWIASGVHFRPIGVDVEKVQEIDLSVAERFFASQEVEDLFALPENQRLDYFYTLWTLKESYIKAVGKGVSIPLDSFWFRVERTGVIHFGAKDDQQNWIFRLYDVGAEYKLAVCVLEDGLPEQVEWASRELILCTDEST